jgi:lysophospholipase L1-like esterase
MSRVEIPTRRAVVIGGAVCLAFALLLVGIGEALVRYREQRRTTVPGTMPFLWYQHARLGHAAVRGMSYFGWVEIDSAGLRRGLPPPENVALRILADGGSTTFDTTVEEDELTWPARLQYWLKELNPSVPVQVLNAGVPGYRVMDNVIRLQTELYALRPDLIVLLQGHNDLFGALIAGASNPDTTSWDPRPDEVRSPSRIRIWLTRNSLLFAKVQDRVNAMAFFRRGRGAYQRDREDPTVFEQRLELGARNFERDLRIYTAVARSLGIPVVLLPSLHVTPPQDSVPGASEESLWQRAMPFAPPAVVLEGYRRYNAVLHRVASESGATFIDLAVTGIHGTRYYAEGDPIHFNRLGADHMARELAKALIAAGALPEAPPRAEGKRDGR